MLHVLDGMCSERTILSEEELPNEQVSCFSVSTKTPEIEDAAICVELHLNTPAVDFRRV